MFKRHYIWWLNGKLQVNKLEKRSFNKDLPVLLLCVPGNCRRTKMAFCPFSRERNWHNLRMASSDSQIDKPQHGCPKRAELPHVNINTGAQGIITERAETSETFWGQFEVSQRFCFEAENNFGIMRTCMGSYLCLCHQLQQMFAWHPMHLLTHDCNKHEIEMCPKYQPQGTTLQSAAIWHHCSNLKWRCVFVLSGHSPQGGKKFFSSTTYFLISLDEKKEIQKSLCSLRSGLVGAWISNLKKTKNSLKSSTFWHIPIRGSHLRMPAWLPYSHSFIHLSVL